MGAERPSWLGKTERDEPPQADIVPGQIYRVHTSILSRRDAHPDAFRPTLVVTVNRDRFVDKVFVVTRTSDVQEEGVSHGARIDAGLTKDGVFSPKWYQSVELMEFCPPFVQYLYDLRADEPQVWDGVNQMLEEGL